MITITYQRPGEPSQVLQVSQTQEPTPGPEQLKIKMKLMPITPADLATIRGVYRTPQKTPSIPGYNGVGIIEAVGEKIDPSWIGRPVVVDPVQSPGWTNGTWSQYVLREFSGILPLESEKDFHHTFDFFNTPLTAYMMVVEKLNLQKGQTVLVTAAGSNVARIVFQLAKIRGFDVIGVVRRPEQIEEIMELGAKAVVCSSQGDISQQVKKVTQLQGVDAVLDCVSGDITAQCLLTLKNQGRMIVYGLLDPKRTADFDVRKILFDRLRIEGFWVTAWWETAPIEERSKVAHAVLKLIANGQIQMNIEKTYPLTEIIQAVSHAEQPGNSGRIALDFSE